MKYYVDIMRDDESGGRVVEVEARNPSDAYCKAKEDYLEAKKEFIKHFIYQIKDRNQKVVYDYLNGYEIYRR